MSDSKEKRQAFFREREGWVYPIYLVLVGCPLILMRLPLIVICVSFLLFYHYLLSPLIIFTSFRRTCDLIFNALLMRIVLFITGFISLPTVIGLFKSNYNNMLPKMNSGYIVICNHSSPIDYLYFIFLISPRVIKYSYQVNKEYVFGALSFFQTIYAVLSLRAVLPRDSAVSVGKQRLVTIVKQNYDNQRGPVLLFPSGCPSNLASCVMMPETVLKELFTNQYQFMRPIVMFKLTYQGSFYSPVNISSHPVKHFLCILANFGNYLNVRHKVMKVERKSVSQLDESDFNSFRNQVISFYTEDGEEYSFLDWSHYEKHLKKML